MTTTLREAAEILVIDDDAAALSSTAAALTAVGYRVYRAGDRSGALRVSRGETIDLVICDVHMGRNTGLELSQDIRKLPGMQDVPFMFVSRTQLPDIVRRSHEAGAAYYLRKPLDPDVLTDLVGKALWMPHLVQTRLSLHHPAPRAMPSPNTATTVRAAAVQGIRLPLA